MGGRSLGKSPLDADLGFYSPAHRGLSPKPATALLWALPGRQITFEGFGTGPTSYARGAVLEPSSAANLAPVLAPTTELPAAYLQPWPTLVTPHPAASRLNPHPPGPPRSRAAHPG